MKIKPQHRHVTVNNNSPIQDYVHPNNQTQPTFEMTPGFKPFTVLHRHVLKISRLARSLPACRRLLFPLLYAEKECLRNAVANRVPASRWQGILFRINCEIISG